VVSCESLKQECHPDRSYRSRGERDREVEGPAFHPLLPQQLAVKSERANPLAGACPLYPRFSKIRIRHPDTTSCHFSLARSGRPRGRASQPSIIASVV
jgi:hypothetical protein